MAHRLLPEAETGLDEIWLYIAKKSGSMDMPTDWSTQSLTVFNFWLAILLLGGAETKICEEVSEALARGKRRHLSHQGGDVFILHVVHRS